MYLKLSRVFAPIAVVCLFSCSVAANGGDKASERVIVADKKLISCQTKDQILTLAASVAAHAYRYYQMRLSDRLKMERMVDNHCQVWPEHTHFAIIDSDDAVVHVRKIDEFTGEVTGFIGYITVGQLDMLTEPVD